MTAIEREQFDAELLQPIPVEGIEAPPEKWKAIPITPTAEPLVAVGPFSGGPHDRLMTDSLYAGERTNSPYQPGAYDGDLLGIYLREGTANRIREAETMLPPGHHLVLWDGYRSLEMQASLYRTFEDELIQLHPDWTEEERAGFIQDFVSKPSTDPGRPSPHNTGGSIDLDIVRLTDEGEAAIRDITRDIVKLADDESKALRVYELEMLRIGIMAHQSEPLYFGTPRDQASEAGAVNYFEKQAAERELDEIERIARDNRRMLYNVMARVGMRPLESEWWHFNDPNSQMGAYVAGLETASYGPAELTEELRDYEAMRRGHLDGNLVLVQRTGTKLESPQLRFLRQVVQTTGHPRETSLPTAEIITPR